MSRVRGNDVRAIFNASLGPLRVGRSRARPCWSGLRNVHCSCLSTRYHQKVNSKALPTVSYGNWARQYSSVAGKTATPASGTTDSAGNDVAEDDAPRPPLAVVFTDIVKSTAIWEEDTASMSEAMVVHDDLVRRIADKYAGYEVKQNGDGFMFTFQAAISALRFCLDVQLQLQQQEWPADLLEIDAAEPIVEVDDKLERGAEALDEAEGVVLWKGLRLRMSIHFGEPVCRWNEVIGRMDYLGPVVNRAARFVGVCEGGQIVVSQEFLQELKMAKKNLVGGGGPLFDSIPQDEDIESFELDLRELQSDVGSDTVADTKFEVSMLGVRQFKGVSEGQKLFFIIPKSLRGRMDYFPRHKYVQASKGNLVANG